MAKSFENSIPKESDLTDGDDRWDVVGNAISARLLSSAQLRVAPFNNAPGQDFLENGFRSSNSLRLGTDGIRRGWQRGLEAIWRSPLDRGIWSPLKPTTRILYGTTLKS